MSMFSGCPVNVVVLNCEYSIKHVEKAPKDGRKPFLKVLRNTNFSSNDNIVLQTFQPLKSPNMMSGLAGAGKHKL